MDTESQHQVATPITVSLNIRGWEIEQRIGFGPLGGKTAVAIARKAGHTIEATASAPVIALEMLKNMIRRREG